MPHAQSDAVVIALALMNLLQVVMLAYLQRDVRRNGNGKH